MYAGGRDAFGVGGPPGLLERGEEKVRMGRGRTGRTRSGEELEEEEEDMTEAFRLRSASEGIWVGSSGEGVGDSREIMSAGASRHNRRIEGTKNTNGIEKWIGRKGEGERKLVSCKAPYSPPSQSSLHCICVSRDISGVNLSQSTAFLFLLVDGSKKRVRVIETKTGTIQVKVSRRCPWVR